MEVAGEHDGDQEDRHQVVEDRECEQETAHPCGESPSEQGEQTERERAVRRGGDRPATRCRAAGDQEVHACRSDDAAERRDGRHDRRGPVAEAAVGELVPQLDRHQEEEHGEQAVADEVLDGEVEADPLHRETEITDGDERRPDRGCSQDQGEAGCDQQQRRGAAVGGDEAHGVPQVSPRCRVWSFGSRTGVIRISARIAPRVPEHRPGEVRGGVAARRGRPRQRRHRRLGGEPGAVPEALGVRAAQRERLVEHHVVGRDRGERAVVPRPQQPLHDLACGGGLGPERRRGPPDPRRCRAAGGAPAWPAGRAAVPGVLEHDDADAAGRVPAHVRAVPGVAAGMADRRGRRSGPPRPRGRGRVGRCRARDGDARLLHRPAQAGAENRVVVAGRAGAGEPPRPRRERGR